MNTIQIFALRVGVVLFFCRQHIKMFVRWRNLQMNRSIMLSPDDVLPCPGMSGHVLACPVPSCPVLSWPVLACPGATTTATTLYRLLFIYYLFDMLGVVAWLPRDGQMMGGAGCQLVLGLLLFVFWASLFIYLFIIIVMLCVSFLNLYSII